LNPAAVRTRDELSVFLQQGGLRLHPHLDLSGRRWEGSRFARVLAAHEDMHG
jgi:hypothetical protein